MKHCENISEEEEELNRCDLCKKYSPTFKFGCGHCLHIKCLNDRRKCPICGILIKISKKDNNLKIIEAIEHKELFTLIDFYIEDDTIIDYDSLINEFKRRCHSDKDSFDYDFRRYEVKLSIKACVHSRMKLVKFFRSINTDKRCSYIATVSFALASISGNMEIIDYLLGEYGNELINENPPDYLCSIQYACICGNTELFDYLVDRGADLLVMYLNRTLLHFACYGGSFEIIKKLIKIHKFSPNLMFHYDVESPLHYALKNPKYDYLFFNNALEIIPDIGELHEKTDDECLQIVKLLVEHGADLDVENELWPTPVAYTGLYNREKVFDFLIDYSLNVRRKPLDLKKHSVLSSIAKCGKNMLFFEKIIGMGVDVNWVYNDFCTALMSACTSGNLEMCARLIELGADVNLRRSDGYYPTLFYLCKYGKDNVELLEFLIEHGADVNLTGHGMNVLHLASRSLCLNIVKKLLEIGLDPNSIVYSYPRNTALHLVLDNRCSKDEILAVAKALIEAGADVDAENCQGKTPLDLADNDMRISVLGLCKALGNK